MRKKYSDPLMFPAVFLAAGPGGDIHGSQDIVIGGGEGGGDSEWGNDTDGIRANGFMMNSAPAQQAAEPLTINPVEEAVTSTEVINEEPSGAASSTAPSPLEVAPVIDEIVPDETASAGVSE